LGRAAGFAVGYCFCLFAVAVNLHVVPYMFGFQAPPKAARYYTEFSKENEKIVQL
jgi:hypothetical protein